MRYEVNFAFSISRVGKVPYLALGYSSCSCSTLRTTAADKDDDDDKNEPPTIAKTTKKRKSSSSAKRSNAKSTGDEPIDVDTPPPKKHKVSTNRTLKYFSTICKTGYTVNPWWKGAKNYIDAVFHDGSVLAKSEEPNITLDKGV